MATLNQQDLILLRGYASALRGRGARQTPQPSLPDSLRSYEPSVAESTRQDSVVSDRPILGAVRQSDMPRESLLSRLSGAYDRGIAQTEEALRAASPQYRIASDAYRKVADLAPRPQNVQSVSPARDFITGLGTLGFRTPVALNEETGQYEPTTAGAIGSGAGSLFPLIAGGSAVGAIPKVGSLLETLGNTPLAKAASGALRFGTSETVRGGLEGQTPSEQLQRGLHSAATLGTLEGIGAGVQGLKGVAAQTGYLTADQALRGENPLTPENVAMNVVLPLIMASPVLARTLSARLRAKGVNPAEFQSREQFENDPAVNEVTREVLALPEGQQIVKGLLPSPKEPTISPESQTMAKPEVVEQAQQTPQIPHLPPQIQHFSPQVPHLPPQVTRQDAPQVAGKLPSKSRQTTVTTEKRETSDTPPPKGQPVASANGIDVYYAYDQPTAQGGTVKMYNVYDPTGQNPSHLSTISAKTLKERGLPVPEEIGEVKVTGHQKHGAANKFSYKGVDISREKSKTKGAGLGGERYVAKIDNNEFAGLTLQSAKEWIDKKQSISESQPTPLAPQAPKQKEPWEMTENEYIKYQEEFYPNIDAIVSKSERNVLGGISRDNHEDIVKDALREGKPVPPEVLADYPDLAKKDDVFYHGTPSKFDKFSYEFLGTKGTSEGKGFYFTSNPDIAEQYKGGEQGNVYAARIDIRKPLNYTGRSITEKELLGFIRKLDEDGNGYLSNFGDVSSEGYENVLRKATKETFNSGDENDVDLISGIINAEGGNPQELYKTLKKTLGYDGIIVKPEWGNQTIKIAFSDDQIHRIDKEVPNDKENITRLPSNQQAGQAIVQARPNQEGSGEATGTGRVLQTQEGQVEPLHKQIKKAFTGLTDDEARGAETVINILDETATKRNPEFLKQNPRQFVKGGKPESEALKQVQQGFYPKSEEIVKSKVPNKAPADVVRKTLLNNGVKEAEVEWLYDEVLDRARAEKRPVTREELLDAVRNNQDVEVEVKKFGYLSQEDFDANHGYVPESQFSKYTTQAGGENYRELLITLPRLKGSTFQSSHFNDPNILAHVRADDRTTTDGQKTLFIHEMQSDWAREGREKGFTDEKLPDGYTVEHDIDGKWRVYTNLGGDEHHAMSSAYSREDAIRPFIKSGVTEAPFVRNWQEMTAKQVLKYAVDNGYDRVSWAKGADVADMFDLRKVVKNIYWAINPKKGTTQITVTGLDGNDIFTARDMEYEEIGSVLGKGVQQKIADGWKSANEGVLSGESIAVGGEWATHLYDEQFPATFNKLGKRYGIKTGQKFIQVEPTTSHQKSGYGFNENDQINVPIHSFEITPELKKTISEVGQELFQDRGNKAKASIEWKDGVAIIRALQNPDFSSVVHETAHYYRKAFPFTADEQRAIARYSGALKNENGVLSENWTREAEEKFARAFERYLREGKAPTPQLSRIFAQIKQFMAKVYAKIKGSDIDVKMDEGIRLIFDEMFGANKPEKLRELLAKQDQATKQQDALKTPRKEFIKQWGGDAVSDYTQHRNSGEIAGRMHRYTIEQSLKEGVVPSYSGWEKDYPELSKEYKGQNPPQEPTVSAVVPPKEKVDPKSKVPQAPRYDIGIESTSPNRQFRVVDTKTGQFARGSDGMTIRLQTKEQALKRADLLNKKGGSFGILPDNPAKIIDNRLRVYTQKAASKIGDSIQKLPPPIRRVLLSKWDTFPGARDTYNAMQRERQITEGLSRTLVHKLRKLGVNPESEGDIALDALFHGHPEEYIPTSEKFKDKTREFVDNVREIQQETTAEMNGLGLKIRAEWLEGPAHWYPNYFRKRLGPMIVNKLRSFGGGANVGGSASSHMRARFSDRFSLWDDAKGQHIKDKTGNVRVFNTKAEAEAYMTDTENFSKAKQKSIEILEPMTLEQKRAYGLVESVYFNLPRGLRESRDLVTKGKFWKGLSELEGAVSADAQEGFVKFDDLQLNAGTKRLLKTMADSGKNPSVKALTDGYLDVRLAKEVESYFGGQQGALRQLYGIIEPQLRAQVTYRNPFRYFRQIPENYLQLYFGDTGAAVNIKEQSASLREYIKGIKGENAEFYDEFIKDGHALHLQNADYLPTSLWENIEKAKSVNGFSALGIYDKLLTLAADNKVLEKGLKLDRALRNAYQHEDVAMRYHLYRYMRKFGKMSRQEASQLVNESFFDYENAPLAIQSMAGVVPFVPSVTYQMSRILGNHLKNRPTQTLMKIALVAGATAYFKDWAAQQLGLDEKKAEKLLEAVDDTYKIVLPMTDRNGKYMVLDLRWLVPFSDVSRMWPDEDADFAETTSKMLPLSVRGPVTSAFDRDVWGRPLDRGGDFSESKGYRAFKNTALSYLPGMAGQYWYGIYNNAKRGEAKRLPLAEQALVKPLVGSIQHFDPQQHAASEIRIRNAKIRDIDEKISATRKRLARKEITKEEFFRTVKAMQQQRRDIIQRSQP